MIYRIIAAVVLIGLAAPGAPVPPAFEVASVKPNQSGNAGGEGSERESLTVTPGAVTLRNVSLRSCLRWAYGLKDFQISGPGWLASARFDIAARTPPASNDQLRLMMQTLLADRFKMAVRRETRDLPVYTLVSGRNGPKFHQAESSDLKGTMRPAGGGLEFRNFSMAEFAESLAARPLKLERPVIDRTGLTGRYDFTLKFADNDVDLKHTLEGIDRGEGLSLLTVIQEQLGLKLQPQKGPVDVIVVDHAEKLPTGN